MSWDRIEKEEKSKCACGKGLVIRRIYKEEDDWNQIREGIIDETIQCPECKKKYHIEHYEYYVQCPRWESDGHIDRTYLVPSGYTLKYDLSTKRFTGTFEEEIAISFSEEEIDAVIIEMNEKKYSTRLSDPRSKEAVRIYYSHYKKKSLNNIIPILQKCKKDYHRYKWNKKLVESYRIEEQNRISENRNKLEEALSKSVELEFK